MNLLAIDASSDNLSLAILKNNQITFDYNRRIKFGASRLPANIDRALKKTKLKLENLDAFVLGGGPGSFTGLRISFSIIKALVLISGKPVIALPSFYSCAYALAKKSGKIVVISDARKGLTYSIAFKVKPKAVSMARPALLTLAEAVRKNKDCLFCTYNSGLRNQALKDFAEINFWPEDIYPKAGNLIKLVTNYKAGLKTRRIDKLQPLYLHPKTCQIKNKP